jgi:hypothetical protein
MQTKTLADRHGCRACGWPGACPNRYCSAHREYRPPVTDKPRKPRTAYERLLRMVPRVRIWH